MKRDELQKIIDDFDRVNRIFNGENMQTNKNKDVDVDTSQKPKSQSWLYRLLNSTFKVVIACVPLGVIYVVLAGVVGLFGGIGSKVFSFFFNILGA